MFKRLGERGTILFAAIVTIICSLGQGICAILGILLYMCKISTVHTFTIANLPELMHLVYFWNQKCTPNLRMRVDGTEYNVEFKTNEIAAASRTQTWMMVYAAVNVLLLLSSLLMIIAVSGSRSSKCRFGLYCPWILVAGLTLLLDIVAAVFYGMDIPKINNIEDLRNFLEITSLSNSFGEQMRDTLQQKTNTNLQVPSIIMTVGFCRLVIFWILNLLLVIFVTKAALKLSVASSKESSVDRPYTPNLYPQYSNDDRFVTNRYDNDKQISTVSGAHLHENTNPVFNVNDQPLTKENLEQWNESLKRPPQNHWLNKNRTPWNASVSNGSDRGGDRFNKSKSKLAATPDISESEEDRTASIRSAESDHYYCPVEYPQRTPKDDLSEVSNKIVNALKRNVSDAQPNRSRDSFSNDAYDLRPASTAKPPGELRSQLPWSYFQSRENPITKPKKTFTELREDEDLPPVPVPDYTLHFPKRPREGSSNASQQVSKAKRSESPASSGSWQGQEVLY